MASHLCFSIFLLTLCAFQCTKGCVKRDRLALLDFKKSFSRENIDVILSSWNSSEEAENCCVWEGIACDNLTGHVVSLNLSAQFFEGHQLRPSLAELQHLETLDLGYNDFDMPFPDFIASLSELTSLDLSYAGFFGVIPPQLGNLSRIKNLGLASYTPYTLSTPNFQWLSRLSFLSSLDLSNMNFTQARDWFSVISELPNLSTFCCEACHFPVPELSSSGTHRVNSSSSLLTLHLEYGFLPSSVLSLWVNSTSNLLELYLDQVFVDEAGMEIFFFSVPIHLDFHLDVGVFHSIGNLCSLKTLQASGCIIKHTVSDIFQALSGCASSSLERIGLGSTNLTGAIPSMLNFRSLSHLGLMYNCLHISSTLPLFPPRLDTLILRNSNLNGVLSHLHFTNISCLETADLANNPNLVVIFNKTLAPNSYIDITSCNLGPSFPSWLLAQNNFVELHMSHCNISDAIPILFWRNLSPSLLYLDLSYNSLYGVVPNLPIQFSGPILIIDLNSNALSGPIPFFLFSASNLDLSNNRFSQFSPIIPPPYNLSHAIMSPSLDPTIFPNIVDLSNNLLSGTIPHWLGFQVPRLGALNLENNNLSGPIPSSVGHLIHLYQLSLRNNSLSGPLPSLLKNCSSLSLLHLGGNRFSGFIPSWIGEDLKNLALLSLRSNSLVGVLPTSLCHLSSIQILDVSHNMLSGNIPTCVQNLAAMKDRDALTSWREEITSVVGDAVEYVDYKEYIEWKSREWKFESTLDQVKLIDLSSNNLSGEIPTEITSLVGLDSLDLSCNSLQGGIPRQIGQLKSLQLLNLSYNRLDGHIPPTLEIPSLEMLDLSHNNLSGRIPSGTQLGSFNSSSYSGNPYLCGEPLDHCPGDQDDSPQALQPSPVHGSEKIMEDEWPSEQCFLGGMGAGFAFGFLGIMGTLTWISKWRYAFFHFSTRAGEWILLAAALTISKLSTKLRLK